MTPPIGSYHIGVAGDNTTLEAFYTQWDAALEGFVPAAGRALGPGQQLILNEFVNSIRDWCDPAFHEEGSHCPDWQQSSTAGGDPDLTHGKGVPINRATWAWNAAAGVFAYAFGTLAEHGYLVVGHDQLVAGTWPDNEPTVAMLDWVTGDPNAKYYVTQLLASTVGAAVEKALFRVVSSVLHGGGDGRAIVYALPFRFTTAAGGKKKGVLLVNKKAAPVGVTLNGLAGARGKVVEVAPGFEGGPGFQPPQDRAISAEGHVHLGPLAVAVLLDI